MSVQALTLPTDITWRRLAYSRDLIDTNFGDPRLPPKWRSSLAVYSYVVPAEQTAESYPDAWIVYLRLICSITGWNPSENLSGVLTVVGQEADKLDDLQRAFWDVIQASQMLGAGDTYWPCLGAIAQIGVYPHISDQNIGVDDYPHILDFEPKKRELYETRTESGEMLSGSSDKLNVQKGTTTLNAIETNRIKSVELKPRIGIPGVADVSGPGASYTYGTTRNNSVESVDVTTTDGSRERRETTSHSTTINQMYQLFNGYHLGTNRAVFSITPRPHILNDAEQAPLNLVNGQRKLEGLQDVFLVVHVPKVLKGLCVQANLDTGHHPMNRFTGRPYATHDESGTTVIHAGVELLVVTRRTVQNCALFNETGALVITGAPAPSATLPPIVFEQPISREVGGIEARAAVTADTARQQRIRLTDQMNNFQVKVANAMLSGFSAGRYEPCPLEATKTFATVAQDALRKMNFSTDDLARLKYLTPEELKALRNLTVKSIGDLFKPELLSSRPAEAKLIKQVRSKIVEKVLSPAKAAQRNK